ncbi:MAG: class I SAM-dependent methyltransferase [Paracoccaceae bacterium]
MWILLVQRILRHLIRTGDLRLIMPDGSVFRLGDGQGETITVHLKSPDLPKRIALRPELAVGEGYMNGDLVIDDDDLTGFLTLLMQNYTQQRFAIWWQQPLVRLRRAIRRFDQFNLVGNAQANVAHHYDLSEALFKLFLDEDMQYSCGYFRTPKDTLEQAQNNKKAHIARKLLLEPGMSVLDIGCGWGGLALTLARDYGAKVTGVTLSKEQHTVATKRARAAGLQDQVEFRHLDYRHVSEVFDRIVSVGMFEHVGAPHYREYFGHVRRMLKLDGVALIHTIGRSDPPGYTSPFTAKYIFPGGYLPAMSETIVAVEHEALCTTDIEVWRLHYAQTLSHWHARFMANIERAREIYDERFCRMWRYYLTVAELAFRYNHQVVFQYQLSHRQDAVPLTRDYLYQSKADAQMHRVAE